MESKFTGGLFGLIINYILQILITVFTLGIGLPWAVCIKEKWVADHTIIDGRRLVFDGNGLQLFGNYIKWWFFCIITFGIYSFWLGIKMKQWIVKHTHLV